MNVKPGTLENYYKRSMQIYEDIRANTIKSPTRDFILDNMLEWINAIEHDSVKNLDKPWSKHCTRYGYKSDMTGAVAEGIAQYNLSEHFNLPIRLAETEEEQSTKGDGKGTDFWVGDYSVQSKSIHTILGEVALYEWYFGNKNNRAKYYSLVDIDDRVHYFVLYDKLATYVYDNDLMSNMDEDGKFYIRLEDLLDLSEECFDNISLYK